MAGKIRTHVYDEQEVSRILSELERYLAAFDSLLKQLQQSLRKRGFIRFCRSRAGGNPVKLSSWIPAFAGMTN